MGEWKYSSTIPDPGIKVSGQIQDPKALPPGTVPIVKEAG
jgi:hypothetical protein